jgi:hypothetical protein
MWTDKNSGQQTTKCDDSKQETVGIERKQAKGTGNGETEQGQENGKRQTAKKEKLIYDKYQNNFPPAAGFRFKF